MCWQAPDSGVIGIIYYDTYVVSIDSVPEFFKVRHLPHLINERRQFSLLSLLPRQWFGKWNSISTLNKQEVLEIHLLRLSQTGR